MSVANGNLKEVGVYAKEDLSILYKKGEESSISTEVQVPDLVAPLEEGQVVGKIAVTTPQGELSVALAVEQQVQEQSFSSGLHRLLKSYLGLMSTGDENALS